MGLAELLALVVGYLMPPAVAYVTAAGWPSWAKLAVAFAISAVLGTVTALATGELAAAGAGGWLNVVLVVFAASQLAYRTWWHRAPSKEQSSPA